MNDNKSRVEQFFSGLFVECWRDVMPEAVTEQEAEFLARHLKLAPACRVLDVPCGAGRHSCALAARGYRVTGVDLSSACLAEARALAAKKTVNVAWERFADVRGYESIAGEPFKLGSRGLLLVATKVQSSSGPAVENSAHAGR